MSEHSLVEALRLAYLSRRTEQVDTVEALRIIFASRGYDALFDYHRLAEDLWSLAPAEKADRESFAAVYESGAINSIRRATQDPYHYATHFTEAELTLEGHGMDPETIRKNLHIFYDALGFPTDAPLKDPQRIGDKEGWIYVGETKNGRPHGRGCEELIYGGSVYNRRRGVWISGEVYGYFCIEETFGTTEHCFYVAGMAKGISTHVAPDGEIFTDEF